MVRANSGAGPLWPGVTASRAALVIYCLILTNSAVKAGELDSLVDFLTPSGGMCDGGCPGEMCTTVDGVSEHCTTQLPRKIWRGEKTKNEYLQCVDACKINDGSWCHTPSSWEYCYPGEIVYVTDNMALSGQRCTTPCKKYSGRYMCYDSAKSWVTCFPFPEKHIALTKATKKYKVYGEYTKNGYKECTECMREKNGTDWRKRRSVLTPSSTIKNAIDWARVNDENANSTEIPERYKDHKLSKRHLGLNFFRERIDVGVIAAYYETDFPEEIVREVDPNNIVTTDSNPVLSYSMYPLPASFGEQQHYLPLSVRSLLTNHTRSTEQRQGNRLQASVERHYQNMSPIPRVDERFHLVADRFNGPSEIFNIFPGTWYQNRGRLSRWNYMEADMARFLNSFPNGYIEHTGILSYDFFDVHRPTRPNAIGLRLRFYNDQHVLSDALGNPLNNRPNPYENMYYNNDPDYCCLIEGDQSPN